MQGCNIITNADMVKTVGSISDLTVGMFTLAKRRTSYNLLKIVASFWNHFLTIIVKFVFSRYPL